MPSNEDDLTPRLQLPKKPYLRRPTDPLDAAQRVRLLERASEQLHEIEVYFNTVDYWNRTVRQPHEQPIDADPDGEMAEMRAYLTTLLRGAVD